MKKIQTKNKSNQIVHAQKGFKIEFNSPRPETKKAKTLILKTKKSSLKLNGFQINTLRRILGKGLVR